MDRLAYTVDRFLALLLVNDERLCLVDGSLRLREDRIIEPAVFAALLVLYNAGYITEKEPQPESLDSRQTMRLTSRGLQLLIRYHKELAERRSRVSDARRPRAVS
jgi:hypothetical protein